MPESKKLSELIDELIQLNSRSPYVVADCYIRNVEIENEIVSIKNQIDQKFEELRCECGKEEIEKEIVVVSGNSHEDLFTKTYIIPPEIKNKKGESKIRTYSTNSVESCCLKRGIEFTYYDGKLITIGCLEHRYESYSSKNP